MNSGESFFSLSQRGNQWWTGRLREGKCLCFIHSCRVISSLVGSPRPRPRGRVLWCANGFCKRAHLLAVWRCNYAGNGSATAKWKHQQERKWSYTRSQQCAARQFNRMSPQITLSVHCWRHIVLSWWQIYITSRLLWFSTSKHNVL